MTIFEARKEMLDFAKKHNHETILFSSLSEEERFIYIMIKTFRYFDSLKRVERLQRAIDNAEAHKKDGYSLYLSFPNENMTITD